MFRWLAPLWFLLAACATAPSDSAPNAADVADVKPHSRASRPYDDARQRRGAMMGAMAGALREWMAEPSDQPLIR